MAMTEKEWLFCSKPEKMIQEIQSPGFEKGLEFFICASLRQGIFCVQDPRIKNAVQVIEQFVADPERYGEADAALAELRMFEQENPTLSTNWRLPESCFVGMALSVFGYITAGYPLHTYAAGLSRGMVSVMAHAHWETRIWNSKGHSFMDFEANAREDQADILRCIFSNPYQQFTPNPEWRTDTVLDLAMAAYDTGDESHTLDPARLLVLSDALEDAGCTVADSGILTHLREPGVSHYRECHALAFCRNKDVLRGVV